LTLCDVTAVAFTVFGVVPPIEPGEAGLKEPPARIAHPSDPQV
jgi:hypothetical protein